MLVVKPDSAITSTIFLLEADPVARGRTLRRFLVRLKPQVEGTAGGTDFRYTRTPSSRLLRIRAKRSAWNSAWHAEIRVISADLWSGNDEVTFELALLHGPTSNVPSQERDALSAAQRIRDRLDAGIDALIQTVEFQPSVSR